MRSSICKIEGCANKPIARGWCNTHYRRFRRYGDPLKTVRKPVKGMTCTVENCQSDAYSAEMCRPHYEKNRLYGDPNYERVLVRDQACSIEGCENNIHARDLDRKSTRLNSSHVSISYAVFCLKKKNLQA